MSDLCYNCRRECSQHDDGCDMCDKNFCEYPKTCNEEFLIELNNDDVWVCQECYVKQKRDNITTAVNT
jgi:hypothetical protein